MNKYKPDGVARHVPGKEGMDAIRKRILGRRLNRHRRAYNNDPCTHRLKMMANCMERIKAEGLA